MTTVKTIGALAGAACLAFASAPAVAGPLSPALLTPAVAVDGALPVIKTGARVGRGHSSGLGIGLGLGLGLGIDSGKSHKKNGGLAVGVGADLGAKVDLGRLTDVNVGLGLGTGIKLGSSHKRRGRY
ncbi:MAG: hypothetical protein AB7U38_09335 [Hyphomicrobiales bacterium]